MKNFEIYSELYGFSVFTWWLECGSSSVVERQPSKLRVAGSNPVSRSINSSDSLNSSNGLDGYVCPCSSVGRAADL